MLLYFNIESSQLVIIENEYIIYVQVVGITLDTIDFVDGIIATEINSATDNPLVFQASEGDDAKDADIISAGDAAALLLGINVLWAVQKRYNHFWPLSKLPTYPENKLLAFKKTYLHTPQSS